MIEEESKSASATSQKRGFEESAELKRNKTEIPLNPPVLLDKETVNQVIKELINQLIDTSTNQNNHNVCEHDCL